MVNVNILHHPLPNSTNTFTFRLALHRHIDAYADIDLDGEWSTIHSRERTKNDATAKAEIVAAATARD